MVNSKTTLDKILQFACPSIQYRMRKELLHQSPAAPEMTALQEQIMQDVKRLVRAQASDGWIGQDFHGYDSMEAGIRLLCEKGLESTHPVLARALDALEKHTDRLERGLGKVGKILDDLHLGGTETIRAYLFAQAGREDSCFVQEQIPQALEVFSAAGNVEARESLYQDYQDKLIFREGICWPSIYHLRLLALTQSWRTLENRRMIAASIQQIVDLSPIPAIHVKWKSQLIAPASFCMDEFTPDMNRLTDAGWMQWFHRMELLARLEIVDQIPALKHQVQVLADMLQEGHWLFTRKLNHVYFRKWGAYTGLALERDWRLPQRRINDLTFRSLLILHYSGIPVLPVIASIR